MSRNRTVLYLDLKKRTSQVKVHADTYEYIGGLGLSLKLLSLLKEENPVIFSIGPFNNSFPFVSKVCSIFYDMEGNLVESYAGGRLGLVLSLTSFEAVVVTGRSVNPVFINISSGKIEFVEGPGGALPSIELSNRSSFINFDGDQALIDRYFRLDPRLGKRLRGWGVERLTISADHSLKIEKRDEYSKLYREILTRGRELSVPYGNFFSCAGCPAGCSLSAQPEYDPSLTLSYCLVACGFAANIFNSVPTVFACFQSLGFDYPHEVLEEVSDKIKRMRSDYAHL